MSNPFRAATRKPSHYEKLDVYSSKLIEDLYNNLDKNGSPAQNKEDARLVLLNLIRGLIALVVYETVSGGVPSYNKTEAASEFFLKFKSVKESVEEAVESGVVGALKSWCDIDAEYACSIDFVPLCANKEMC